MTIHLRAEALAMIDTKQADLMHRHAASSVAIAEAMSKLRALLSGINNNATSIAAALAKPVVLRGEVDQDVRDAVHRAQLDIWSETMSLLATPEHLRSLPQGTMDGVSPSFENGDAGETRRLRVEKAFEDANTLQQYLWLASQMGENELIDVLVAAHIIQPNDRQYAIRIIGDYLGEAVTPEPGGGGWWKILGVGNLLKDATVKEVMNHHVRRAGYLLLLEKGADDIQKYKRVRRNAGTAVRTMLLDFAKDAGVTPDAALRDYITEVETFFMGAAGITLPATMVQELPQEEKRCPVLSWRQCMALMELDEKRHGYVGFEPGYGKSLVAYGLHERKRQRSRESGTLCRTLYIGPKMVTDEQPNSLRPGTTESETASTCYYPNPEKDAPTVGHIHEGMTEEQIDEEIIKEVVFCPYSMLTVELKTSGMTVAEKLRRAGDGAPHWTQIVFDEAHSLQGDSTWTRIAHDLIHKHPKVYDEGNVLLMSGTPAIGHLKGLAVQLALLQSDVRSNEIGTGAIRDRGEQKGMSAAELRMALLRWFIRYDIPEDWMQYVDACYYDLSTEEMDFLQLIASDQTLTKSEKLGKMQLFIRCPELVSGESVKESTLFNWVATKLEEDLDQKDVVLIAEHMRSNTVLREDRAADEDQSEADLHFYARVQSFLTAWQAEDPERQYVLHVIHGTTKKRARNKAYADAKKAKKDKNFKCIILAHSGCLNMGIDLRSVQRITSLEWPWNSPEILQLLRRSQRAGNEDIRLHAFIAQRCVEEAIVAWAQSKFSDAERCIEGDLTVGDEVFAEMQEDDNQTENAKIARHLSSPEQQMLSENFFLHNKGPERVRDYWNGNPELYQQRLQHALRGSQGNRHRALAAYVRTLEEKGIIPEAASYLQTNSQGFALHRLLQEMDPSRRRSFTCMEPTQSMINAATRTLALNEFPAKRLVGTPDELIGLQTNHVQSGGAPLRSGMQDVVILDGLEQMHFKRSEDGAMHRHTRVNALIGAVRAVKLGGRIIIPLPREACTEQEFRAFGAVLENFSSQIDTSWTDVMKSLDNEGDAPFEMFIVSAVKIGEIDQELVSASDQNALSWTHHNRLEGRAKAERTRRENRRRARKLPFELVHESFKIGHKSLEPAHADDSVREKQLVHLHALREAVTTIRRLSSNADTWTGKGSSAFIARIRDTLDRENIQFLPQLSDKRPAFRLAAYPNHLVFPYDSQWDEDATS